MKMCAAFAAFALAASIFSAAPTAGAETLATKITHTTGEMALSSNGRFIAFRILGHPAHQFVLFDVVRREAIVIEAPDVHVGDLAWSADGDELTFVTAESHTLGGKGRHVWRLRPATPTPTIELLAIIPFVHAPALSADGLRMAAFEGVVVGSERFIGLNLAFAIFERSLLDGQFTRRSAGHTFLGGDLRYDRHDALFVRVWAPVFLTSSDYAYGTSYAWTQSDSDGRFSYQWSEEIGHVSSFRIAPGDRLPPWPTPYPENAPRGASLVRPLDDGRIALHAPRTPGMASDWYDERGQARPRSRDALLPYDYAAYTPDGSAEVLVQMPLPGGAGRTGGADLSSDGRYFAQIIGRRPDAALSRPDDGLDSLMYFENGALMFEASISAMLARAQHLAMSTSETPLMPAITEPHRILVDLDP